MYDTIVQDVNAVGVCVRSLEQIKNKWQTVNKNVKSPSSTQLLCANDTNFLRNRGPDHCYDIEVYVMVTVLCGGQ